MINDGLNSLTGKQVEVRWTRNGEQRGLSGALAASTPQCWTVEGLGEYCDFEENDVVSVDGMFIQLKERSK